MSFNANSGVLIETCAFERSPKFQSPLTQIQVSTLEHGTAEHASTYTVQEFELNRYHLSLIELTPNHFFSILQKCNYNDKQSGIPFSIYVVLNFG